jgi:hypothetical protein
MTTQYRVLVHCDGLRTPDCHGMLDLKTPYLHRMAQHADIVTLGWARGYTDTDSYDLCPVCKKLAEAEERAQKRAEKEKEQAGD